MWKEEKRYKHIQGKTQQNKTILKMNTQRVIEDIERRYNQYRVSTSDTFLYYKTMDFLDYLKSNKVFEEEMERIKQKFPFKEDILGDHKLPDKLIAEVYTCRESYVSFVLHFLDWTINNKENYDTLKIYDEAYWICSSDKDYSKEMRIKLFQQEVIYPIITYLVDKMRSGLHICSILEQFKARSERFKCLAGIECEEYIQNRIALYLFDSGNESHREENSGNGCPDFLISNEEGLFVIEVKYVKKGKRKGDKDLEEWTSQLKSYMSQYSFYYGVLYIVTEENCEYVWQGETSDMTIMNVYVGSTTSSKRDKPYRIEIKI